MKWHLDRNENNPSLIDNAQGWKDRNEKIMQETHTERESIQTYYQWHTERESIESYYQSYKVEARHRQFLPRRGLLHRFLFSVNQRLNFLTPLCFRPFISIFYAKYKTSTWRSTMQWEIVELNRLKQIKNRKYSWQCIVSLLRLHYI